MLCGGEAAAEAPDGGVDICQRGVVFIGLPALVGLGGFLFAQVQERKIRKMRTLFPLRLAIGCVGVVDWLRLIAFFAVGVAPAVSFLIERAYWNQSAITHDLVPYRIIDLFVFGLFLWCGLGCAWLLHEVRRGSQEWSWLRYFTFIQLVGESLRLWSTIVSLDHDYPTAGHREFVVISGITMVLLKFLAFFFMVCFNRNWRRLRSALRAKSASSDLRSNLIAMAHESFLDEQGAAAAGSALEGDVETEHLNQSETGAASPSNPKLERTPEQYAGLLSRLFFWWMEPIMRKGYKRELEEEDFYKLMREDEPHLLSRNFSEAFKKARAEKAAKEQRATGASVDPSGSGDHYERLGDQDEDNAARANETDAERKKRLEKKGSLSTIVKAMHRGGILTPFYQAAFFKWIYDSQMFVGPQILRLLITYLNSEEDEPAWKGYLYVALMFVNALTQTFMLHIYFHKVFRTGMRVRSSLLTTIYRKSLRLTPSSRQLRTTGEVVNLMSTDCERLNGLFPYLHVTWSSPYQVILALFFLWNELRYSVLVSVAVIFVVMTPLTAVVAGRIKKIQKQLMKVKDARIRATGEAITSIKVIKLYGWERKFREQVAGAREDELNLLRTYVMWRAAARTLWSTTPVIVTLATFATFVLSGGVLDAATAFTSLSLLNILRFPLAMLPNIFNSAVEAAVSLRRIASFLDTEELDLQKLEAMRKQTHLEPDVAVKVKNGNFYWDDKRQAQAVADVNFEFKEGTVNVITGEVGSGKSALLNMLIGELQPSLQHGPPGSPTAPQIGVRGSVALSAQVPWIQNATLRDNILFGCPYDREWYNHVVYCCSLTPDIEQLPDGDATEIGERGINLSGGQKARVSLARAVYSRADVILLETCFEAVDEHVGSFLWEHCFQGILREPNPTTGRQRTVLLVTHALKYVHDADSVLVLKNGRIVEQGSFDDIIKNKNSELARLAVRVEQMNERNAKREAEATEGDAQPDLEENDIDSRPPVSRKKSSFRKDRDPNKNKNLTGKEDRAVGQVSWSVYKQYMNAVGGPVVVFSVMLGLLVRTIFDSGTSAWLAYWSNNTKPKSSGDHGDAPDSNSTAANATASLLSFGYRLLSQGPASEAVDLVVPAATHAFEFAHANATALMDDGLSLEDAAHGSEHGTGFYLGIYALLSFTGIIFIGVLTIYIALVALNASRSMHNSMLQSVCRAPMAFFDTTPIGRILNRFSKDIYTIDETLPDSMFSFLSTVFNVVGTVATISIVTPPFLAVLPFLGFAYFRIQRYYIATSRQVKRWDSVMRSPIYSHFSESLDGASTIRAYSATRRFSRQNQSQLEQQLGPYYISIASNRWLAVRLEFIGTCLVLFTSLFVVVFNADRAAAFGALAISYSLSITQTLNWTVRMSSEIETNVISVERVNEYIEVKPEAPEDDPDTSKVPLPSSNWPAEGAIEFQNVSARYRPGLEEVVKNVSIKIEPGHKVGIVGRTGSGKSTLTLILLRLIEPSQGRILIDGYDSRDFGLERLRQAMSIIPQDPVMFSATLRQNLDPLNRFTDAQIWRALEVTQLKTHVEGLITASTSDSSDEDAPRNNLPDDPLQVMITEGGGNFSFGQRQLICIARAVLRRCRIILLDEATSGIDSATDELIQTTIRTELKESTVLTIAHRLTTIEDGDRILVMDKGRVAEYDTPAKLLGNKASLFSKLVEQMEKKNAKKSRA